MTRIHPWDLTTRAYRRLRREDITTIGQLTVHSAQELLDIRGFGDECLADVRTFLAGKGLALRPCQPRCQCCRSAVHPGEILQQEFLSPLGISQSELAIAIDVPPPRINEIVLGKRAITADTALRLAVAFRTSGRFWLNLQNGYDLEVQRARIAVELLAIRRLTRAEASDARS